MLSLYLHIPFCKQKCAYCAFYSAPGSCAEKERYTEALCASIRAAGSRETRPLSTLYCGGGTPALLGTERLSRVLEQARRAFSFERRPECTVELNPESTTPALLAALREAGVNRLSLGVQSLQEEELRSLRRPHDAAGALAALELIFRSGFTNVSADVMFGLPGQTAASFADTLDRLLAYPITHLSAYSLQLEPGTPLAATALPMEEEQEEQLWLLLCRRAAEKGMTHYEISNFALPGFESRHNLAYWRRTDYIGLGSAAHSFLRSVRYAFPDDREEFIRHPWPLCNPQPIGAAEAREEAIMLGLRTAEGVPLRLLPAQFQPERYRDFAFIQKDRLILNERGFYLTNSIISDILSKEY